MSSSTLSIVLATQNRREVLLSTLGQVFEPGCVPDDTQVVVVVNPSTDGSAEAVRSSYPQAEVVQLRRNLGSCAKAKGIERCRGTHILFLDDDSYPHPGACSLMLDKFAAEDKLAVAGFVVHLPDGRLECSAFPDVYIGCGAGFRRDALEQVGGLDHTLFMQAEEYDLSFRLINAGWKIETFNDLHVEHLKTAQARLSRRTIYHDTRNNLLLAARYLPDETEPIYQHDWQQRYRAIAAQHGHLVDYWRGRLSAARRRKSERRSFAAQRLSPTAFEQLFRWSFVQQRMEALAEAGVKRLLLADLGKNVYPFVASARAVGIEIIAVADDRFSQVMQSYRGCPIRSTAESLAEQPDAIVIANTSTVHAEVTQKRLEAMTSIPLHRWFGYDC